MRTEKRTGSSTRPRGIPALRGGWRRREHRDGQGTVGHPEHGVSGATRRKRSEVGGLKFLKCCRGSQEVKTKK